MGQKVHPKALRLGIVQEWDSKWFSQKEYASQLHEDIKIREFIKKRLRLAGISKVKIERTGKFIKIEIYTARPGRVIGEKGQGIENLKTDLQELTDKQIYIGIVDVKVPELDAQLVAENIAFQIEKQISFRRAMKKAINSAMQSGALGIKVAVSGRLGGAEIARREWVKEGRIPLHTFRADIDYGFAEAFTTYGQIGIKVWIFKKEIFKQEKPELKMKQKISGKEKAVTEVSPEIKEDKNINQGVENVVDAQESKIS